MSFRFPIPLVPLLALAGCLTEPSLKAPVVVLPPATEDGWPVSTPAMEGFDSTALRAALAPLLRQDRFRALVGVVVARNGRLVLEAYARDTSDRSVARNVQSIAKSVTSLVAGPLLPLDGRLYDVLGDQFDSVVAKRTITFRDLFTMRSGLRFDNEDFTDELENRRPRHQARYILAKPLYAAPGDSFYYRDADPQLVSAAVQRATGRRLDDWAEERLFAPLGIPTPRWERNIDGETLAPHGLFLRPRELAKLGEVVLERGQWQGRTVLPAAWVDSATAPQVVVPPPSEGLGYGFYWWTIPATGVVAAWGHGGNFVLIDRAHDLVLVITALPDVDDDTIGAGLPEVLPILQDVGASTE